MNDALAETLAHWRRTAFAWGVSDCLWSVADYAALRGVSHRFEWLRGTYATEYDAVRVLAAHGGHKRMIDALGLPRIDPDKAARGDIVTVAGDKYPIAGICTGNDVAMRTERGVVEIRRGLLTLITAWDFRDG